MAPYHISHFSCGLTDQRPLLDRLSRQLQPLQPITVLYDLIQQPVTTSQHQTLFISHSCTLAFLLVSSTLAESATRKIRVFKHVRGPATYYLLLPDEIDFSHVTDPTDLKLIAELDKIAGHDWKKFRLLKIIAIYGDVLQELGKKFSEDPEAFQKWLIEYPFGH